MGKYLELLRGNKLEFNQSEETECHIHPCSRTDETKKLDIPTLTHCQNCQNLPLHAQTQADGGTPTDETARQRVRPEIARRLDDADVLQLGSLLLKLDAGEEIE